MSKIISKTKLLATTAICAISTFSNNAKAEVIPDPSTIAPDVITLTESSETTHSGNYIVLYDTDEGVNKYYDITLKTTTYGTGAPSTEYTAKVPYENVTITVNGVSDERIDNLVGYTVSSKIYHGLSSEDSGAAIYNSNTLDSIKDSIFISNKTNNDGGAIWTSIISKSIANSLFMFNVAHERGGGLFLVVTHLIRY